MPKRKMPESFKDNAERVKRGERPQRSDKNKKASPQKTTQQKKSVPTKKTAKKQSRRTK